MVERATPPGRVIGGVSVHYWRFEVSAEKAEFELEQLGIVEHDREQALID
jgi:hypothetical protein